MGRMKAINETSARVLDATAQMLIDGEYDEMDVMERLASIDVVKIVATENAIDVIDQGMRLVGGQSFRRGHVLERLYRDARSGPFHPLTTDQEHDLLGKIELGLTEQPPLAATASGNGSAAERVTA
jgi:alkylation response protein AidB-like acyl-CoA dehydrogenase